MDRILLLALAAALAAGCSPGKSHYKGGGFGPAVYVPDFPQSTGKDGRKLSRDEMWKKFGEWSDYLRQRIRNGKAVGPAEFDKFFNDTYFRGDYNSMKELYEVRKRLSDALRAADGGPRLQSSLDQWARDRFSTTDFRTTVTEMAGRVTFSIEIPGLNQRSINLNITESAILLSFERRANGKAAKPYMKIYPVPDSARPGSERIGVSGDFVHITFARR